MYEVTFQQALGILYDLSENHKGLSPAGLYLFVGRKFKTSNICQTFGFASALLTHALGLMSGEWTAGCGWRREVGLSLFFDKLSMDEILDFCLTHFRWHTFLANSYCLNLYTLWKRQVFSIPCVRCSDQAFKLARLHAHIIERLPLLGEHGEKIAGSVKIQDLPGFLCKFVQVARNLGCPQEKKLNNWRLASVPRLLPCITEDFTVRGTVRRRKA